jgi:hypothetical protein
LPVSRAKKYRQNSRNSSILPVFRAKEELFRGSSSQKIPAKQPEKFHLAGI